MDPQYQVAKLLRDHGVSDAGILQIYYKQTMTKPEDRESLRNLLLWVVGYMQSCHLPPMKIPLRER